MMAGSLPPPNAQVGPVAVRKLYNCKAYTHTTSIADRRCCSTYTPTVTLLLKLILTQVDPVAVRKLLALVLQPVQAVAHVHTSRA